MRIIVELIYWPLWLWAKICNGLLGLEWNVVIPLRVWMRPDPRPSTEIVADIVKHLEAMPATKEVYAIVESLKRSTGKGAGE